MKVFIVLAATLAVGIAAPTNYRENDAMADTESHENPSARSYNGAGSPLAGLAASSGPAPSSGPAFGVFPNANLGGCATPLLLSCSPKVVSGHILKHTSYAYPVAIHAPAYREAEMTHEMEMNMKEAGMEKSQADHETFQQSPVAQDHHNDEAMQHKMARQGNSLQHSHNLGQMTKL